MTPSIEELEALCAEYGAKAWYIPVRGISVTINKHIYIEWLWSFGARLPRLEVWGKDRSSTHPNASPREWGEDFATLSSLLSDERFPEAFGAALSRSGADQAAALKRLEDEDYHRKHGGPKYTGD